MTKILIIEDDKTQGLILQHTIKNTLGCDSILLASGRELKDLIQQGLLPDVDCAVVDLFLPDMDGIQITRYLKEQLPDLPIVVMTHYGNRKRAMMAIQAGARDFLHKPIPTQRLKVTLSNILETEALRKAIGSYKWKPEMPPLPHTAPLGISTAYLQVLADARAAALSGQKVLILGEAGVGKTVLAQHILSLQGCDSYTKQAWKSSAIPTPPPHLNSKNGVILMCKDPLTSHQTITQFTQFLNSRPLTVGCATASSVGDVAEGLSVESCILYVPPLRERRMDISILTDYFLQRLSRHHTRYWLDAGVADAMYAYDWPGNVAELEQFLTAAAAYTVQGRITLNEWEYHLQRRSFAHQGTAQTHERVRFAAPHAAHIALTTEEGDLRPFKDIEEDIIMLAMRKYDHSPSLVARHLQLGRTTIYRKVQKLAGAESN